MKNNLITIMGKLPDPRLPRKRKHHLMDILVLTILAILCGAESWDSIALFGKKKHDFLKTFLKLPNGIPSHDTINRVFSILNPEKFEKLFIEWTQSLREKMNREVIAIDGKTLRGSKDSYHGLSPIHLVNAWATENELVFGQFKTDCKSNEITAIPELLDLLDIEHCVITIDAMGTQKNIAHKIIEKKGDYILSLKGNHQSLQADVEALFNWKIPDSTAEQSEKGHGRIETRKCEVIHQVDLIDSYTEWGNLSSVIRITAKRTVGEKSTSETRLYISSINADAMNFNEMIRKHWRVENSLHWTLDVTFHEDQQRKRNKHAAQNFSVAQKIALNLLKADNSIKASLRSKRLAAAWDNEFLLQILMR